MVVLVAVVMVVLVEVVVEVVVVVEGLVEVVVVVEGLVEVVKVVVVEGNCHYPDLVVVVVVVVVVEVEVEVVGNRLRLIGMKLAFDQLDKVAYQLGILA
ncbi:hypothetical protein CmeUKMEL1_08805 [Cryptosporidium meleagridis]|uniref:Uncharacterized protein n=1 Tax=Cryptosporidium meleagridis TaxID=93969 RepID=A0A2P4Z174_9CRYT|nr:hypothetical protein CmeUKMEL1_08805 [Cryptosporidium meleagridis]